MEEVLRKRLKDTRDFDGCIDLQVYHEPGTNTLTLIQDWESIEHYDRYSQWRQQGDAEDLIAVLEPGPVAFSIKKLTYLPDI